MLKNDPSNTVCAVVPIKRNSERVIKKNFRSLGGRPLYRWLLDTLVDCKSVSSILVDTDSDELLEELGDFYPEISVRRRPDALGGALTSMDEVLRDLAPVVPAESIIQLHVTNPFLTSETIDSAVEWYLKEGADSAFSVSEIRGRLWSSDGRPMNHDPKVMERTQDMVPIYKENSCFFLFRRSAMIEFGARVSGRVAFYPINEIESIDIDTEDDFRFAELIAASKLLAEDKA